MTAPSATAILLWELNVSPTHSVTAAMLPPDWTPEVRQTLADRLDGRVELDGDVFTLLPDPDDRRWSDEAVAAISTAARTILSKLEQCSPLDMAHWQQVIDTQRIEPDHFRAAMRRLIRDGLISADEESLRDLVGVHPVRQAPKASTPPRPAPPKAPNPAPAAAPAKPTDSVDAAVRRAVSSALMTFGWMALNSPVGDFGKTEVEQALRRLVDEGLIHQVDDGTWGKGRKPAPAPKPEPVPAPTVEVVEPTPELKPDTTDENDDTTPEPKPEATSAKPSTPPRAPSTMSPDLIEAFNATILEVREVRRDIRAALAPITAAKLDTAAAHDLISKSDEMTGKVLVRVIVCLHVYGEMTRTELRKKMNSTRLPHLPEAIALGLRIGAIDANARGGRALRLIDHSAVMTDADLERAAAEQRQRDESNRRRPAFGRAS